MLRKRRNNHKNDASGQGREDTIPTADGVWMECGWRSGRTCEVPPWQQRHSTELPVEAWSGWAVKLQFSQWFETLHIRVMREH